MAVTIREPNGGRSFTIEGDNAVSPGFIFMLADNGAVYQFPKAETIAALKQEFGLIEPPKASLEKLLAAI